MARLVSLMLAPLLVVLADEFNTSVAVAGQLAAVMFVTWGITAPLVGSFSDTYGRRPVLLTGLAIIAIGVLGSAAAWSYTSFRSSGLGNSVELQLVDRFPFAHRSRSSHDSAHSRGDHCRYFASG
jgi:MFS family permease